MNETGARPRILLLRLPVALLIVALHGASVFLKVFLFRGIWAFNSGTAVSGGEVLLFGWLGFLVGIVGWFANVFFIPGLIMFAVGELRFSRWITLAALLIAFSSLLVRSLPNGSGAGGSTAVASFGPGLYAWLGSMVVLTAGTFIFQSLGNVDVLSIRDPPLE